MTPVSLRVSAAAAAAYALATCVKGAESFVTTSSGAGGLRQRAFPAGSTAAAELTNGLASRLPRPSEDRLVQVEAETTQMGAAAVLVSVVTLAGASVAARNRSSRRGLVARRARMVATRPDQAIPWWQRLVRPRIEEGVGIWAEKLNMTTIFDEQDGNWRTIPATILVIKRGGNVVTGKRWPEKHGYYAVQMGYDQRPPEEMKYVAKRGGNTAELAMAKIAPLKKLREFTCRPQGRRRSRSSSPGAASAHSNGTSHHESAAQGAFMEHVHQIGSAMASFFSGGSLGARGRGVDRRRNHSRDSGSSSSERDDEQSDHRGSFHESMHHQVPEERHKDLSSPPFEPLGPVPPRTSPTTSQNGFHGVAGASAAASPPQTESRLPKAYGSFLVISDRTYESPSAAQPGGQTPPAQATQPASFVLPSGKDPLGGSMRSLEAAHPASFEQFSGKDPLGGSMRNSEVWRSNSLQPVQPRSHGMGGVTGSYQPPMTYQSPSSSARGPGYGGAPAHGAAFSNYPGFR
eukprot:TRINITY_DN616_c0_g1_i6.p1 TRINITY_DN616_c0_g1~~TRINITY_DN616_c0_g1_i6.p1  ORF type:complete len:517 (-),score=103.48 TRINITY_DN616_c0_g1_i6:167-1717(-)